jgi:hypothetical protein
MLSVILQSIVILSVAFFIAYAGCHYEECDATCHHSNVECRIVH